MQANSNLTLHQLLASKLKHDQTMSSVTQNTINKARNADNTIGLNHQTPYVYCSEDYLVNSETSTVHQGMGLKSLFSTKKSTETVDIPEKFILGRLGPNPYKSRITN